MEERLSNRLNPESTVGLLGKHVQASIQNALSKVIPIPSLWLYFTNRRITLLISLVMVAIYKVMLKGGIVAIFRLTTTSPI